MTPPSMAWGRFRLRAIGYTLAVWCSLILSLALLFASGIGVNGVDGPGDPPWLPSGEVIGAIWSTLYTLMGLALAVLDGVEASRRSAPKRWVLALYAFCLVWPFHAFATANRRPGLLGNIGVLVLALLATASTARVSRVAAVMIAPTVLWVTIATASILDGARRFGW